MTLGASLPDAAAKFLTGFVGEGWTARPLLGDASTRQYFRVGLAGGGTRILAYYPPELRPQLRRFLDAYAAVSPHARIPEVLAYDEACTLQTDVGDRLEPRPQRAAQRVVRQSRRERLDGRTGTVLGHRGKGAGRGWISPLPRAPCSLPPS